MELEIYRSSIDAIGLALSVAGTLLLFNHYRERNTFLMVIGLALAFITHMVVNYCIGLYLLDVDVNGFLCSPVTFHLRGIGFLCFGMGLVFHVKKIKLIDNT